MTEVAIRREGVAVDDEGDLAAGEDGGWMTIVSPRAEIEAVAKVTQRMRPLKVDGRVVHQVGLPWHWGHGAYTLGMNSSSTDTEPSPSQVAQRPLGRLNEKRPAS